MGNLISFMKEVADGLRESGNYGTAHIYRSSMSAILAFNASGNLPFRKVTPEFLKSFEAYLRGRNCSWNTVSTYMRTLRAVYNRAVDRRIAPYVPHHFRYVYTGTRADKKRALEKEDLERLMKELPKQLHSGNRELQRARGFFILMFLLRGMPFVDLAYLKKHDIDGNVLTYRRRKTGRMLTVTLLPEAVKLIKQHMNTDPAPRTIMQSASKFLHFSTVTILLFTEPLTYKLIPTTVNVPITPKNIITHKIFIIIFFFPFFIISPFLST